jgi:hypothetical protein
MRCNGDGKEDGILGCGYGVARASDLHRKLLARS